MERIPYSILVLIVIASSFVFIGGCMQSEGSPQSTTTNQLANGTNEFSSGGIQFKVYLDRFEINPKRNLIRSVVRMENTGKTGISTVVGYGTATDYAGFDHGTATAMSFGSFYPGESLRGSEAIMLQSDKATDAIINNGCTYGVTIYVYEPRVTVTAYWRLQPSDMKIDYEFYDRYFDPDLKREFP